MIIGPVDLSEFDDETLINLFRAACAQYPDSVIDVIEAEIERRGIYGRKRERGIKT